MHGLERLAKKASSKAQESNEAVITERHLLSVFQVGTFFVLFVLRTIAKSWTRGEVHIRAAYPLVRAELYF